MKIEYRRFVACKDFQSEKTQKGLQKKVAQLLSSLLIGAIVDKRIIDFLHDTHINESNSDKQKTPLEVFVGSGFDTCSISPSILMVYDVHYKKHGFTDKKEFFRALQSLNEVWEKFCTVRKYSDDVSYSQHLEIIIEFFYVTK